MIRASFLLGMSLSLLTGCGPATSTVTGEVTYEGNPVEDGYITFAPVDGKGNDGGGKITNGKYRVEGIQPGTKQVKVIATKKVNFASNSDEMKAKADKALKAGKKDGLIDPADIIPDTAVGNNAKVEIAVGESQQNFALKKPAR